MLIIVFLVLLAVSLSQGANSTTLIFNAIDGNNDDIIRLSEMFVGYDEDDGNKDGMMTPEEFAAGKHPGSPPLSIKKAFEFYDKRDKEKNNILDGSCVNAFFKGLDTNNDEDVTREEFEDNYFALFLGFLDSDSEEQA